ncbi:N-acetylglucosamine/diacetylchitobiose ABC transporter substrate-binding protein [Kribbella solani]|uniref:N-acetylglucosamine transport system substrate-binding protein n=1 Tax=Kribbella solani TaxID=236067 RepID=A0A841DLD4_9ACTN|nr:N-acetylglucosamine/diacetylchitobiose ABC transporter substrate-binding protein [Kribbella solani]MBB5977586.1 N-acetylglucosamine transport system substrate-binding protein [Kribbella solani]MDX2970015.1 N-acetylglucosamine/diacetylchitobiose ABC transporter substrate-binding protein [Kribbella solani]MDX3001900.1 N-acetylglucosamine/diacetylchitobiose ABC transporter substrate-binding protein [Kribbella solani]
MSETSKFGRRSLLKGSLAAAAVLPLSGTLASCASSGNSNSNSSSGGTKSDSNPFGMADKSTVDAVIFNGGYGYDYVSFAANIAQQKQSGSTFKVAPSTQIAQQLQPRFVGGNPPDLIDNSGANQIGFNTILDQLETLDDVFEAKNYEGTKIADTLYAGVKAPGTFGDKFVAINYVLTLYGLWYSDSLFKANGWEPPKTYEDLLALGAKAKAKGKYLFVWGKEAATYYQTLAVDSAIKEGGDPVRLSLGNLEADCWSKPEIQGVFKAMETMVKSGYFVPGGAGTQFTAAQAKWSNDQQAILYPSGSWIENEMKKATKAGFDMKGIPEPTLTANSKLPYAALRSAAGEPYIVPSKGKNVAGGKELLRAMLSKDAATNFSKTRLAPTIVKGLVPADGFGSTALQSQTQMLDAAGTDVFDYQFVNLYGTNPDQLVVWNSFLSGQTDAAGLTKGLQQITDKVRNDSSVKKIPVTK